MKKIIDGENISNKIAIDLQKKFLKINKRRRIIKKKDVTLSVFVIGINPTIESFVKKKEKFADKIGINFLIFRYKNNISEKEFLKDFLEKQKKADGVIIQLPLPEKFNTKLILKKVNPEKDVDVLNYKNINKFKKNKLKDIFPPVAGAVSEILNFKKIKLKNKKIVIVGKGKLTGGPVSDFLKNQGLCEKKDFQFLLLETKQKEREKMLKEADFVISGAGSPNIIKEENIKKGVFLIDMGTSSIKKTLIGDISLKCIEKCSYFSKTPGGVGPITVAILFKNLLNLVEKNK